MMSFCCFALSTYLPYHCLPQSSTLFLLLLAFFHPTVSNWVCIQLPLFHPKVRFTGSSVTEHHLLGLGTYYTYSKHKTQTLDQQSSECSH